ncbi:MULTISPECIES: aminoglycoside phosphotransferase family protein [Streptomyces]|uniref:aminoglycoside phosphotransferase family protein n=1 Tax=Streptomyces TaxID=1883 RepID=UPI000C42C6BC|nr:MULTISPECIES: aminoglycoside phosphotransferase family protein [Streptomyces]PIB09448.1 aminoglycoside phosphotransferase [Streptomyces sp. HG99]
MSANSLLPALTAKTRLEAHPAPGMAATMTATAPCPCGTMDKVLADRDDGTVVRHGDTVAKAHAPGTDPTELSRRLAATTHPALRGILLTPLSPAPVALHGRQVTFWPYGSPVDPENPDAAPWEAAATLLARLHRTPAPHGLPPMRGPRKAATAIARLRAAGPHPAAAPVLRAWAGLPAWARAEAPMPEATTLCHGDLHLGQLVRHPAPAGPWLLIDVDDLGVGTPAWDLARPAAWYACGLLPPDEWLRFLTAYRRAAGPAVPADGDPWPALDVAARALTVQTAALAIAKSAAAGQPLDEVQQAVIDACDRMGTAPPELAHGLPT